MQFVSKIFILLLISMASCQFNAMRADSGNQLQTNSESEYAASIEKLNRAYIDIGNADSIDGDWTKKPWTESALAYQEIRTRIDKEFHQADVSVKDRLLIKYKDKALRQPSDPKAQFAWGYAIWTTRDGTMTYGHLYNRNYVPIRALRAVSFQPNYEFARLRFLFEGWQQPLQTLRALGERLIHQNPNDADVKRRLASIYSNNASSRLRQQAVQLAQESIALEPAYSAGYADLGAAYLMLWHKDKDVHAAQQAIVAYRKYLELAPPSFPWRIQAQTLISLIENELKQYNSQKTLVYSYIPHYF